MRGGEQAGLTGRTTSLRVDRPQPHTTRTATDVELLLAHLKGTDDSLDTAIASDDERAVVASSDPLFAVAEVCRNPGRPLLACSSVCNGSTRLPNEGDDPHLD